VTQKDFDGFLSYGVYLAFAIAIFNLIQYRKKGWGAVFLAGGTASFAAGLTLYRTHAPYWAMILMGIVMVGFMLADVVFKTAKSSREGL